MVSTSKARSIGSRAIAPRESKLRLIFCTPSVETVSDDNFIPYRPETVAGYTTEPAVSVPILRGLKPAATETPDPAEEPADVCFMLAHHASPVVGDSFAVPAGRPSLNLDASRLILFDHQPHSIPLGCHLTWWLLV
jgi:hypothetical protein